MSITEIFSHYSPSIAPYTIILFYIFGISNCIGNTFLSYKPDHKNYKTFNKNGQIIKYITKPFLLPLLCLYYCTMAVDTADISMLLVISLTLSWLGDVALMPISLKPNDRATQLGILFFFFAHISYLYYR